MIQPVLEVDIIFPNNHLCSSRYNSIKFNKIALYEHSTPIFELSFFQKEKRKLCPTVWNEDQLVPLDVTNYPTLIQSGHT